MIWWIVAAVLALVVVVVGVWVVRHPRASDRTRRVDHAKLVDKRRDTRASHHGYGP